MKSTFFKILFMGTNLGMVGYALFKFILYKGDAILTPLPCMLVFLGICCLAINLTYILFTLAPVVIASRRKISAQGRDQKDMTTQGTVPQNPAAANFDQETVSIEAEPIQEA